MQTYQQIPNEKIKDSRSKINANFEALRSNFEGENFPTDPAPIEGQTAFKGGIFYVFKSNQWVREDTLHDHTGQFYTKAQVDSALAGKASSVHSHNDLYFTKAEVTNALAAKAAANHSHNDLYYTESEVDDALALKQSAATAVTRDNLQKQAHVFGTTTGYSTAYVLSLSPAVSALVEGLRFSFKAHVTNSANATLNVSGLGAKALRAYNRNINSFANLIAGQIVAGQVVEVIYDGTNFNILDRSLFSGFCYAEITQSQTWVKPQGVQKALVFVLGASGGQCGGVKWYGNTGYGTTNNVLYGRGGQDGVKRWALVDLSGVTSVAITIGQGGAGGVKRQHPNGGAFSSVYANAGQNGGTTSFGNFITMFGGAGASGVYTDLNTWYPMGFNDYKDPVPALPTVVVANGAEDSLFSYNSSLTERKGGNHGQLFVDQFGNIGDLTMQTEAIRNQYYLDGANGENGRILIFY